MEKQLDVAKTIGESKAADKKPVRALGKPTPKAQRQLSLFQTFYGTGTDHEHLSNVIELWDAAPKYVSAAKRDADTIHQLDYLEREFQWRGQTFKLLVIPATLIRQDGSAYRRFPTAREELVEAALRKISILQTHGFVGEDEKQTVLGAKFSLSMLRKELARHGHDIHFEALLESLMILSRCHVEISVNEPKRKAIRQSSILSSLEEPVRLAGLPGIAVVGKVPPDGVAGAVRLHLPPVRLRHHDGIPDRLGPLAAPAHGLRLPQCGDHASRQNLAVLCHRQQRTAQPRTDARPGQGHGRGHHGVEIRRPPADCHP